MLKIFKRIPWWAYLEGIGLFALQFGLYKLADIAANLIGTKDHAICPKIPVIDDLFPVIPVFIIIYLFAYLFWVCGPIAVSLTDKANRRKFLIASLAAYLVGFLILVLVPTYMSRSAEGLTEIASRPGILNQMLNFVYSADGGDRAFNLCPSFHCLVSWCTYLGVKGRPEISKGFRIYTLIMTILVCLSTLAVKQHYIADVICGTAIAWICFAVTERILHGKNKALS